MVTTSVAYQPPYTSFFTPRTRVQRQPQLRLLSESTATAALNTTATKTTDRTRAVHPYQA